MAASFTVLNGETRITMTWKAPTAKLNNLVTAAAKFLQYAGLGNPVEPQGDRDAVDTYVNGLTAQQKLNIVYGRIDDELKAKADDWHVNFTQEDARSTAAAETATLYELNEEP